MTQIEAAANGYTPHKWEKCPDCLAEIHRWTKPKHRPLFFSNNGKDHGKVCPSSQYYKMFWKEDSYIHAVEYKPINHSEVERIFSTHQKPKPPVAPETGTRMIKLDE